jgi:glycine cleavage system P protein (glycine dehydrogenase) subunit 1
VTAATIYMSLLGHQGLRQVALTSQQKTAGLLARLSEIDGVERSFSSPHFHEAVIHLDRPVGPVLESLAARDILGGYDLSVAYPELGDALLVCATETKADEDLDAYAAALREIMDGAV